MFGYIKPHAPELRVREDAYFRGVYCGLCRAMGRCTGCASRLTLSYDFTALALIRLAATCEPVAFSPRRCLAHPLTRRSVAEPCAALDYCARTAAILGYHKLLDDVADESGHRRLRARLALPALAAMRRRALADQSLVPLDADIARALDALHQIEAANTPSVDRPADAFGHLMRALAAHGLDDPAARVAGQIGYHLGRWLYVVDALDDYNDDIRLGRYNPIAAARGAVPLDDTVRASYREALVYELTALEAALELLDFDQNENNAGVLRNLLYLGLPRAADRVLGVEA